jgi:hypothetical protein
MESADLKELSKFMQKADDYKSALQLAPDARILEVSAIIGVLDGFIKDFSLSKSEVKIVELMSGSGYLTKYLAKCGYKNIHALEASNSMSSNINLDHKYITEHSIKDIFSIEPILMDIKPDIIISLAGFHHLMKYDDKNNIIINESIQKQKKAIDICMKYLNPNGLFILEDIYNIALHDKISIEPIYWNTNSIKKILPKYLISTNLYKKLLKTKKINNFFSLVRDNFAPPLQKQTNPTNRWFNEVVDCYSTIGHKDVPISELLLNSLEKEYDMKFITFDCPWLFNNLEECKNYIISFWFKEHKDNDEKLSKILDKAKKINGIHTLNNNHIAFGWSLSLVTIQHKERNKPSFFFKNTIVLFLILIIISLIGNALKLFTVNYSFLIEIISHALVLFIGLTAQEIYTYFKSTKVYNI